MAAGDTPVLSILAASVLVEPALEMTQVLQLLECLQDSPCVPGLRA